jgi:alpha-ketoglutarate-dependent taurine dioxygenase
MIYRFRDVDFEADMANKSSDDVRMTHSGYLKAVAKDLAHSPLLQDLGHEEKELKIQSIAKSMMGRWKAYASALETIQDHYVRLSIHDSKGGGKLSMALVPQDRGVIGYTPWHSTVAVELDGSYRIVHASEVRDTHELVYVNGRPYYYRAKSDLFDWKADGLDVTFEPQYPTGLFIRPANVSEAGAGPSLCNVPMQKVRQLSHTFSPVVLRGFRETTDEEIFVSKAYEIGQIMEWPSFGKVLKVKDIGSTRKEDNNVTSSEAMPMHFDGVFKFADVTDPATGEVKKVMTPPNYQYFTCISTAAKNTGVTLYANSRLFFRHVPAPWTMERLEKVTWSLESDGYWSSKLEGIPLVERHKETGAPCVRFHEHWPNNTKFSKFYHKIENDDQSLIDVATKVLYDYRVCLRFEWEQGDILVSDNVAMLHTRTAFGAGCDRELWRIHIK